MDCPSHPLSVIAEIACRAQSDDWVSGRGFYRVAGLNHAKLFIGHETGCKCMRTITTEAVNNKISGTCGHTRTLCLAGEMKETPHIFNQRGIEADSNTYVCLLQECINMKDLAKGKQVHAHIIRSGFFPNVSLLNTLVNMYAKCGSLVDARQVFDRMPDRSLFTWTIMMAGYAKHGHAEEAFKIYEQMQCEGVTPDRVTFICILNACAKLGAVEKGKEVHAAIIKAGIADYVNLETALIAMYAKCGCMQDARKVFDKMSERDVVSWNAIIAGYAQHECGREAFDMYDQMQCEGVNPNSVTFISVLSACAKLGALKKGKEVHSDIIRAGIVSSINLENTLVDMYAKCGSMKDAERVFNHMAKRDVVSWNVMITGYAHHDYGREAFKIYDQMRQEGVMPSRITFICLLNACANVGALEKAKEVHADILKVGIPSYIKLENTLVDIYGKCGSIKDAREVFNNMAIRDVVSWSALIAGYVQQGCGMEAFKLYEQMQQEGVTPDRVTFNCALNACAILGVLEKGKQVHADIIQSGIGSDVNLENTLVNMYAKCGSTKDAHQVFDNMTQQDVVSWNAMIAAYAQHRSDKEAFKMFEEMQWKGVTPDRFTFTCVLNVCASLGALEKGKEVHADIMKYGIASDINLETSLVEMYAKCGSIKDAHQVFDNMGKRDVVSWSAMIAGYSQHGCGREALQLIEQMQQEGLKPNGITFMSLLSACGRVGLLDEGRHYFHSMTRDHGLTPTLEHFGCMVDLLGRAGRLVEAEHLIDKIPMKPDSGVWRALLGACRTHGNVQLAERATKSILKTDPQHTAASAAVERLCCSSQIGQKG